MIAFLPIALLMAPPAPAGVLLSTLEEMPPGEMTLALDGVVEKSFLSQGDCLYWEWSYGVLRDGHWVVSGRGHQSESTFRAKTPKGTLELRPAQIRTFLAPSFEKTFDKKHRADAPEIVRTMIDSEDSPITVVEYCLKKSVSYHARVKGETGLLPPATKDGPPGKRKHTVLIVSDKPFVDGKPQGEVTPAYKGWTF